MNNDKLIDLLNDILAAELRSLLPRLRESTVFVDWASADDLFAVNGMMNEELEHVAWLVDAINDVGGDPAPVTADIRSTGAHYLRLSYILPQVLRERRRALSLFESAAPQLAANDRASVVASRIIERKRRHVDHLAQLNELSRRRSAATGAPTTTAS